MNMKLRNIPFSPPEKLWFMAHDPQYDKNADKICEFILEE
jgi:hypothetical protein